MRYLISFLRLIIAVDSVVALVTLPILVIGSLCAGFVAAAISFAVLGAGLAFIYGRYWRRYPLGKFAKS